MGLPLARLSPLPDVIAILRATGFDELDENPVSRIA